MNDESCVKEMKRIIEEIERQNHRDRFLSDSLYKKNIVNSILGELDKVVENEN